VTGGPERLEQRFSPRGIRIENENMGGLHEITPG
jgi:hypothetical protein